MEAYTSPQERRRLAILRHHVSPLLRMIDEIVYELSDQEAVSLIEHGVRPVSLPEKLEGEEEKVVPAPIRERLAQKR